MNVDKFGHHVHKRLRLSEHILIDTDSTLQKSETGDYDLKSSKLKGLQFPNDEDEAVNKAYVDKSVQELKNEIKNIHTHVKLYLNNLEKANNARLSSLFYSKTQIDQLFQRKINKNE
jgi:hypothetical protein